MKKVSALLKSSFGLALLIAWGYVLLHNFRDDPGFALVMTAFGTIAACFFFFGLEDFDEVYEHGKKGLLDRIFPETWDVGYPGGRFGAPIAFFFTCVAMIAGGLVFFFGLIQYLRAPQ